MLRFTIPVYLAILSAGNDALASSFDCVRASTGFEKIICGDPTLSSLDGEMGTAYTATLKKLSPEGVQLVRNGQREWLKMARQSCPLETWGSAKDMRESRDACIGAMYRHRIENINASAVQVGPFLVSRVDKIREAMVEHPPGEDVPRLATQQVAYPRIDEPQSDQTQALNNMLLPKDKESECGVHANGDADGEGLIDYHLTFANEKVLSIKWTVWSYCFNLAHGNGFTNAQNIVLGPTPRPLKPADLFRQDTGWEELLSRLGLVAVQAALQERNQMVRSQGLPVSAVEAIAATVKDPSKWSLHKDGLEVQFDPYELTMGYPGVADILIPWSALKPVLSTPLLVK